MIKRIWDILSAGATIYVIYKKIETINEAKNDFYSSLSEDQKVLWKQYLGDPESSKLPTNIFENIVVLPQKVTELVQIKSGV